MSESSPVYVNTNSTSSSKSSTIEGARTSIDGLNLPIVQSIILKGDFQNVIVTIPSSTTPSFGNFCLINVRDRNISLHNYSIQVVTSAITGTNVVGSYIPGYYWFDQIEENLSSNNSTTFYGRENHTRLNSNQSDEDRYFSNIASGNYASTAQRTLMSSSSTTNTFITSLSSLIDQSKLSFLNSSHNLELKVWFNNFSDIFVTTSGSNASATILSCSLILNVTRLDTSTAMMRLNSLQTKNFHNIFHETCLTSMVVPIGSSAITIPLTSFVNSISHFYFTVRPSLTAFTGLGFYAFIPIASYSLNDVSGNTISNLISHQAAQILNKQNTQSSYMTENALNVVDNNVNIYTYSHSSDAVSALNFGQLLGSRKYLGNETLTINFKTTLVASMLVEIFGYKECILEQSISTIKRL